MTPFPPLRGAAALALAFVAALLLQTAALAAPAFPKLTGRVVDEARILPAATEAELTGKLARLEETTRRQLVVVTLPSLQGYEIADYGYQLGRAWGIGQAGAPGEAPGTEKDNGVLFIVAPSDRKVRIEVGYGLEPVLTDALSSVILQTQVLPRFRAGDLAGGVVQGTDELIKQLSLPEDQARAIAERAGERGRQAGETGSFLGGLAPILFFLFVVFVLVGRRRRGRGAEWLIPIIIDGMTSRGGWSRGGWSDRGGRGGGGFSGGGGSFGGGGASGGW